MALFTSLSERFNHIFSKLTKKGRLTELEIKEAMREVRIALLEADVNYMVAKKFVADVSEKAVGETVMKSLTPGQMVIKIVKEELEKLISSDNQKLQVSSNPPTVLMMCGLQGAGKTTMCGKLAYHLKKSGKKPLLVACDIYRPAAINQLQVVGKSANVEVFEKGTQNPVKTAKQAVEHAKKQGYDTVIIDTAGRLHINEELMNELKDIKKEVSPTEILLVVDAMTGQDAVNVASKFDELINIDGIILTKLDGDTRGGAALSIRAVTGKPIIFCGMGEKLSDLEQFFPDRMASRILGMGDVLTLIEKAEEAIDDEKAKELSRKMKKAEFDYNDYLDSMSQMKNMGGISSILNMLPGMGMQGLSSKQMSQIEGSMDEKSLSHVEAIILSMTPEERANPKLMNPSRKKRIANGAGLDISEVNRFIKQFEQSKKMMKKMPGMMGGKKGKMKFPF